MFIGYSRVLKLRLSSLMTNSLSADILFSQKIVERANENKRPRDMTARARKIFGEKIKRLWTDYITNKTTNCDITGAPTAVIKHQ